MILEKNLRQRDAEETGVIIWAKILQSMEKNWIFSSISQKTIHRPICFLPKEIQGAVSAEIYQDGSLVKTLSLSEDMTFQIEGKYRNEITVQNGEIAITASDCPGEDCVHSGPIHSSGRSIVCLPNGVEVRVVNGVSDVDFVVG